MVNTEGQEYIPKSLIHSWEYCPIGTCCFHQAGSLLLPQPQVKNRFITSSLGQERTCPELDHSTRLPFQVGAGLFSSRSALCVCSQPLLEEVATGNPPCPSPRPARAKASPIFAGECVLQGRKFELSQKGGVYALCAKAVNLTERGVGARMRKKTGKTSPPCWKDSPVISPSHWLCWPSLELT